MTVEQSVTGNFPTHFCCTGTCPWENKWSPWAHRELTVTTVVTAPVPMITAQLRLGEVTAQSRRGHSSVTARSQLSHSEVTAQSRPRSRLSHGWLWPFWSPWAHDELTVSSHGGHFFFSWVALLRHEGPGACNIVIVKLDYQNIHCHIFQQFVTILYQSTPAVYLTFVSFRLTSKVHRVVPPLCLPGSFPHSNLKT